MGNQESCFRLTGGGAVQREKGGARKQEPKGSLTAAGPWLHPNKVGCKQRGVPASVCFHLAPSPRTALCPASPTRRYCPNTSLGTQCCFTLLCPLDWRRESWRRWRKPQSWLLEYLHGSRAEAEAQRGGGTCLKPHSKTGAEGGLEPRCPDTCSGAGDAFSFSPRRGVVFAQGVAARASCGPADGPEPGGRRPCPVTQAGQAAWGTGEETGPGSSPNPNPRSGMARIRIQKL